MLLRMKTAAVRGAVRVLTIDDRCAQLEGLSEELRWSGYLVKSAGSAHEAVLAARGFLPDLLVADVGAPSMDGLAAAVEIKQWDPQCEVLLFSDRGTADGQAHSVKAGGYSFRIVPKPTHGADLRRQIDSFFYDLWSTRRAS